MPPTAYQREHRAGALRHRLKLQVLRGSTSAGSRGQSQKTWTTLDTIRGGINTLRGNEAVLARQIFATATHRIVVRYHASLTPMARLVLGSTSEGGRVFNVHSVDNREDRNRWMDAVCTEVLST